MRILILNKDAVPGGTSRHVGELASGLAARGCDVDIVMPAGGHANEVGAIAGCRVLRPRSLGRALSTELAPGAAWAALTHRADIVHLQLPNPVGVAGVALAGRRPLVVTFQCELDRDFGPAGSVYRAVTRHVLARADRVIVTSEPMRASPTLCGCPARVVAIPLGSEHRSWSPAEVAPADVARHRERLGAVFVLFVGRLVYYKGLDVLVRAGRTLAWPVVLAGDGPERPRLESLADELGVRERVRFLGHVPDFELRALVMAARCVVLPSTSVGEAFGQTLVEAALMGRPAVATSLPTGVPWVNLDGVTGINVPPNDAAALAAALAMLCGDDALASRLGEAARARALAEFTTDRMVERTLALYREVLAGRGDGKVADGSSN